MRRFVLALALASQVFNPAASWAGTKDFAIQGYALPADKPVTVVLMRPDVDVGELQVGGLPQPNADWTEAARREIAAALKRHFAAKNISFTVMDDALATKLPGPGAACLPDPLAGRTAGEPVADVPAAGDSQAMKVVTLPPVCPPGTVASAGEPDGGGATVTPDERLVADYDALHAAVVSAILAHKYSYGDGKLPTKKGKFDYTLGPGAAQLGTLSGGANYGLFMLTYDQFSTDSRKAMQVAGALGCLIGACMIVTGGIHVAYVSLVELETGNIVWFNVLRGSKGDVREADGAQSMVDAIMASMPSRPGERTATEGDEGEN